jgi:peroxiredoxin
MPAIGDKVPAATVMITIDDGPGPANSAELLSTGAVVLIGVPGAFTPVCSDFHLPGFVLVADQLKEKGVNMIAVVSVNDASMMGAWGKSEGGRRRVPHGLDTDGSSFSTAEAVLAKL